MLKCKILTSGKHMKISLREYALNLPSSSLTFRFLVFCLRLDFLKENVQSFVSVLLSAIFGSIGLRFRNVQLHWLNFVDSLSHPIRFGLLTNSRSRRCLLNVVSARNLIDCENSGFANYACILFHLAWYY